MTAPDDGIGIGEPVPDVSLHTSDGAQLRLSSLRGRPLLAVCVRYYG
jgi:peroxiredoxin